MAPLIEANALCIRPYREADDRDQTEAVYHITRRATFSWAAPAYFAQGSFSAATAGETLTVAVDREERVLGFVSVWLPDRFVHHLFILPDFQNQGIGRRLLAKAMAAKPGSWRLKCLERNAAALAFYERLGWKSVGCGRSDLGAYRIMESPEVATPGGGA